MLPDWKGEKLMVKVSKCIKYDDINTGEGNYNAMYGYSVYEFNNCDGTMEQLKDNIIAENILSKVDSEGHQYKVLTEVTDHNIHDSTITKVDGFIKSINGNLQHKRTNHVWKILVEWKDRSVDWFPLKYLKQSNPVELD